MCSLQSLEIDLSRQAPKTFNIKIWILKMNFESSFDVQYKHSFAIILKRKSNNILHFTSELAGLAEWSRLSAMRPTTAPGPAPFLYLRSIQFNADLNNVCLLYRRGRITVNKGICKSQFSAQNNFMMECNIFYILGWKSNQPRHSPQHLEAQGGGQSQDY